METICATIRIVLAIQSGLFRTGLRNLLEREPSFQIAGEAGGGQEAVRLASEMEADILLLDLCARDISAVEVLRHLSLLRSPLRVLLLASANDREVIAEAFRLGARGVILRDAAAKILVQGVRAIMDGRFLVGSASAAETGTQIEALTRLSKTVDVRNFGLTKRELEVVCAVVAGHSNKDIASKFSISGDTVKHHLRNIFDKLGVYNRLELALFAIQRGLIEGSPR